MTPIKTPVQEDGAAVPRPPQGKQDGQGSGGQRRGYIGLKPISRMTRLAVTVLWVSSRETSSS